jgi:hypothetical protein
MLRVSFMSPVSPANVKYIHIYINSLIIMHFLGAYCPMLVDYSWTISIVLFTNHKVSKFIEFTNIWNNFVCLFAKSELVRGQSPPAFVILFLRTLLCFLNSSHSYSKWSVGKKRKKISWKFSHQVKNANGLWYVANKSIHPLHFWQRIASHGKKMSW